MNDDAAYNAKVAETKAWYAEAADKAMSFKKRNPWSKSPYQKFVDKLVKYGHNYDTICHAVAAAGIAAMWAMNRTPQGGITGFQASHINWLILEHWGHIKAPARLVQFEHMLYPQYVDRFEKTITPSTWESLQKLATENLAANPEAHPSVTAHWQSIIDGQVPFGYSVKED